MTKPAALLALSLLLILAVVAIACTASPAGAPAAAPLTEPPPPTAAPSANPAADPSASPTEAAAAAATPVQSEPSNMTNPTRLDNPHALDAFPPEAAYGDYAVGTVTSFAVDNRQRFDPWNTAYASDRYRETLRRIEASGQTRTVVFQLWYPARPDTAAGRLDGIRSPYPANGGQRRANFLDFFFQDEAMLAATGGSYGVNPQFTYTAGDNLLTAGPAPTNRPP